MELIDKAIGAAKDAASATIGSIASQIPKAITKKVDELTSYNRLKWPTELGTLENLHWLEIRGYDFGTNNKLKNEPDNSSGKTDSEDKVKSLFQLMLPVPDNLVFNYAPQWEVAGLAELDAAKKLYSTLTEGGTSVSGTLTEAQQDIRSGDWRKWYISSLALRASGTAGKGLTQYAPNPRRQSLFNGLEPRTFAFSWNMTPKNAKECKDIQDIIKTLKMHALPAQKGDYLFEFPSQFRLTFYHKGIVNKNLPLISYVACTGVNVNYTSAGMWQALKNGHPIDVQMTLNFMELEVITREHVAQGF